MGLGLIIFVVVLVILAFMLGLGFGEDKDPFYILSLFIFGVVFFIVTTAITDGKYISKDIRVDHKVIYMSLDSIPIERRGRVDSIYYMVDDNLIPYNNIVKVD